MKKSILLMFLFAMGPAFANNFEKQILNTISIFVDSENVSEFKKLAKKRGVFVSQNLNDKTLYNFDLDAPQFGYIEHSSVNTEKGTLINLSVLFQGNPRDSRVFGIYNKIKRLLRDSDFRVVEDKDNSLLDETQTFGNKKCYYYGIERKTATLKKGNFSLSIDVSKGGPFRKCYKNGNLVEDETKNSYLDIHLKP